MDTVLTVALLLALVVGSGTTSTFFYLIVGGIGWIRSGGDKAKVEAARNTITSAIISGIFMVIAIGTIELFGLALVPGWTAEHPGPWLVAAAAGTGPVLHLALTALLASVPKVTRHPRAVPRLRRFVIGPETAARFGMTALLLRWFSAAVLLPVAAVAVWFSAFGALVLHSMTQQVTRLAALPLPADERSHFMESQRSNMNLCKPMNRARNLLSLLFGCVRMGIIRRRRLARLNDAAAGTGLQSLNLVHIHPLPLVTGQER